MQAIVPKLSKISGHWGRGDYTDQRIFIETKSKNKTSACIVVQRMAHHNHLVHLNYPHLSYVNLW